MDYNDVMDYFYYCENLESYEIVLSKSRTMFNIIPHSPFEIRSLQELIITTRPEDADVDVATIFSDILESISAPFLQRLSLDVDIPNEMLLAFLERSSFPPLTSLSISADEIFGDDLLDVLRVVPKLTHLELSAAGFFPPTTNSHSPVELSHLTSITIPRLHYTFNEESLALYIFKNLSLPKLQELDVWLPDLCTKPTYEDSDSELSSCCGLDFQPTLIDIQPNIYTELRTLTIHVLDTKLLECFIAIVKNLLNLECLHVQVLPYEAWARNNNERDSELSSFGSTFMKMLLPTVPDTEAKPLDNTSDESHIIYLPKLKDLSYEGVFTTATSQETLIDTLEFRWKGEGDNKVERLKSARIFGVQYHRYKPFQAATEVISKRIEQLRLQGMDLSFA